MKRALEEQYGGEEEVLFSSAQCLIFDFIIVALFMIYLANFDSYHRQILDSITLLLNLPNIQMHTCWCIYVTVTRTR